MGYSHSMMFNTVVRKGVTAQEVEVALKPLIDYFGKGLNTGDEVGYDSSFDFVDETGELDCNTYGDVGYGYYDLVCEVAQNLAAIVEEPGEIELYDHDTGDIDNAKTAIVFGPSGESINAYVAKRDIDKALGLMKHHLSDEKIGAIRALIAAS